MAFLNDDLGGLSFESLSTNGNYWNVPSLANERPTHGVSQAPVRGTLRCPMDPATRPTGLGGRQLGRNNHSLIGYSGLSGSHTLCKLTGAVAAVYARPIPPRRSREHSNAFPVHPPSSPFLDVLFVTRCRACSTCFRLGPPSSLVMVRDVVTCPACHASLTLECPFRC